MRIGKRISEWSLVGKVTLPAMAAGCVIAAVSLVVGAAVRAVTADDGSAGAFVTPMLIGALPVLLVTAGATSWLLRNHVTDPLARARASLLERIKGDQTALVLVESVDEVGQLAVSVNEVIAAAFSRDAYVNGIVQTAADGIIIIDELGLIELYNPAAEFMFGYGFEEAAGSHIGKLLPSYEKLPINPLGMDDLGFWDEEEPAPRYEAEARHQSGRLIPLSVTIGNLPSEEGTRYVLILRDISARKETEEVLRQARDAAEAMSRTKSEFLANMSHEIRTPMNGIIGMTELALDSDLTAEQREYMEAVKISADSLLEIINDILDSSKIEGGHLKLETIEFALGKCLDNALLPLSVRARQKGLELSSEIDPDVPDLLLGDPTRLRQIVINLVSNAIKFTQEGSVRLRVGAAKTQSPERIELQCSVIDTGIGIPAEMHDRVFESFTQADGSTTRKFGGTGLGLSICTQLVEMLEGKIWVESEEGRGSTFHFTVVMAPGAESADDGETPDGGESALEGVKALVIRLGDGGRAPYMSPFSARQKYSGSEF